MALVHPLTLVSAAITSKDVSTAASVYHFVPAAKGNVQIICRLTVAGSGDYVVYLTHQWLGGGVVSIVGPKTTIPLAAGETQLEFVSLWIGVEATDVFEVMVDGLAGDNAVTGDIRIYADNPSVFDPAADTVANVTAVAGVTGDTKQTGDAYVRLTGTVEPLVAAQAIRDALKLDASGGAPAAGSVDTHLDTLITGVAVSSIGNDVITAAAIALDANAEIADAVLDEVIEGTYTLRQMIRLVASKLFGDWDKVGSVVTYNDLADAKARITETLTSTGRDITALDGT